GSIDGCLALEIARPRHFHSQNWLQASPPAWTPESRIRGGAAKTTGVPGRIIPACTVGRRTGRIGARRHDSTERRSGQRTLQIVPRGSWSRDGSTGPSSVVARARGHNAVGPDVRLQDEAGTRVMSGK